MRNLLRSSLSAVLLFHAIDAVGLAEDLKTQSPSTTEFSPIPVTTTNAEQSSTDPTGYDSGLWRAEYLPLDEKAESKRSDKETNDKSAGQRGSARQSGITANASPDTAIAKLINSDSLEFAAISLPAVAAGSYLEVVSPEDTHDSMTDWDFAISNSAQGNSVGSIANGPSITSVIVGVVGILIVIGAYVSSSGKKSN